MKERNEARRPCPDKCGYRVYPRTRTKDWRCSYCKKLFTDKPVPKNL